MNLLLKCLVSMFWFYSFQEHVPIKYFLNTYNMFPLEHVQFSIWLLNQIEIDCKVVIIAWLFDKVAEKQDVKIYH